LGHVLLKDLPVTVEYETAVNGGGEHSLKQDEVW
jgi:hypothetical protein